MNLDDYRNWWEYLPGAYWKRPGGPGTTINGRDRHPVVQVAYEDVEAYAAWVGKELPTEAEWEFAARGGLEGAAVCVGRRAVPGRPAEGEHVAGRVPLAEPQAGRVRRHVAGGSFAPNGYGLFDMTGNVWEWTCDWFTTGHPGEADSPCCVPTNPRVTSPEGSYDVGAPGEHSRAK